MSNILIEHKNHDIYFSLSQENLKSAECIYNKIIDSNKIVVVGEVYYHGSDSDTQSWLNSQLLELKKYVVASIVFSALTAEAFINYYAISKGISRKKLKNNFETTKYSTIEISLEDMQLQYKLPYKQRTTIKNWVEDKNGIEICSTVRKWIEIPKEIKGSYISSGLDGSLIYRLNELFRLRNNLVHHKATIVNLNLGESGFLKEAEDKNYVTLNQAQQALQSVIQALQSLQHLDDSVDLDWLTALS